MKMLLGISRSLRVPAFVLIGLISLAVLSGCAVDGVSAIRSNATITPATPAAPTTPTTPSTPAAPPFKSDLTAVALNTATNRFYVANAAGSGGAGTGEVLVFDALTNVQIDTITAGAFPVGIAVNSVTNTIYVACINSQNVLVIDGATDKVVATLTVGTNPVAIAVNSVTNKIYVADGSSEFTSAGQSMGYQNVTVVNGATNSILDQVAVAGGDPVAVAINTKTDTVYVATTVGLAVINGANDTLTMTLGSDKIGSAALDPSTQLPLFPEFYGSFDVAVDESTNTVYVANESATNTLTVVTGATNTVVESIPLAVLDASGKPVNSPARSLAVNPTNHMVYITMETEDMTQNRYVLSVFNGATGAVVGTVGLVDSQGKAISPSAMAIAVSPTTGLVYTVEAQVVGVINIVTNTTTGILE
jgi:YVTN family beta-propeller protein